MYMVFQITNGQMVFIQSFSNLSDAQTCVNILSPQRPSNTIYTIIQGTVS